MAESVAFKALVDSHEDRISRLEDEDKTTLRDLSTINANLEGMVKTIEKTEQTIAKFADSVDKNFDKLNNKIDVIEDSLKKHETDIADLKEVQQKKRQKWLTFNNAVIGLIIGAVGVLIKEFVVRIFF